MRVSCLAPAAAASIAALLTAGVAGAAPSLRPAAGTPDPRLMVLVSGDLHAKVKKQRYYRDTDFPSTISYERSFREGRTGSTKLLYVDSLAEVGTNAQFATRYIRLVRELATEPGDFTLTKSFLREIGESEALNSTLKVGRIRSAAAGDSSVDIPLSAEIRGLRTDLHIVIFHVDRLIAALAVVGAPGSHVSLSTATGLAKLMTKRMAAELAPKNLALPVLSGSPRVGQALTASSGLWNGRPTRLSYRWERCSGAGAGCAVIVGASGQTYTPGEADAGARIRVSVSARNRFGSTTARSAPSGVVGAASAPTNTALPTINGTAQVGQTLTAATGSWTGSPVSFGFQWQRCDASGHSCAAIPDATANTYAVTEADRGSTLLVVVTATNAAGSGSAASAGTPPVP